MAKQENVKLTSWNRFHTRNLAVAPELLGQSHVFTFDGHGIEISLPSADRLPDDETAGGRLVDERLSISSWRMQDGRRQLLEVNVHNVDVRVSISGRTSIPEEALTRPVKAFELFSDQQQEHLDKLASDYGNLARQAFDLWIRTVRWKADDFRIGLPEVRGSKTGWRTYLREKDTQKGVWAESVIVAVRGNKVVTTEIWNEVLSALNAGKSPPIFYDLLYDAMAHLDRGDLQRTIVDSAVAAETYMKIIVQEGLPAGLNDQVKKYINEANVRRVIDRLFPEHLDTEQREAYTAFKQDLHKLFDDRNTILHSGHKEGLTHEHCQKIIKSVHDLVSLEPHRAI